MFLRCASVSRGLVAVTVAGLLSTLELQPPKARTAATAAIAWGRSLGKQRAGCGCCCERAALFAMFVRSEILPVPPAPAQGLKQRCRVGIAAGLGLHESDARLLIGLLGAEQCEVTRVPVLILALGEIQRGFCGIRGSGSGLQPFGVLGKRRQRV